MKTIWTYWENKEGSQTPPHILLCREILFFQCKKSSIQLITPDNVHDFLPDLEPNIWDISMENPAQNPIAIRCAFIRAFLLEKFGGLYVDADCIALKDLKCVLNLLEIYDFIAMRRTSANTKHISIGFYGSRKEGIIISDYADKLRDILNKKVIFKWGEVGAHLLTPVVNKNLKNVYLYREDQIHPIVAEHQFKFCDKILDPSKIIPKDALCFMLYHRIFETAVKGVTLKNYSADDLYNGNMLISKVLKMAYLGRENNKIDIAKIVQQAAKKNSSKLRRPVIDAHPFLGLHRDSDKILELTHYWTPPVPSWKPLKKIPNSNLRIACIVEERLYQGLRFEGKILLLTPSNWKHILRYAKPDFLLIESIWMSATGHWHMGQCPASPHREKMLEMLSLARKLSIPSVFWITKGHEYHAHYKDLARHCDYVFCADPQEVDLLRSDGIAADLLGPCVQPAIYNPFRHYEHYDALRLCILFDGWADLDRMTDQLRILKEIKPYGLNIIESRYQIFRNRMNALPDYKECIQGCVTPQDRLLALKYADAYVTFHQTLSTRTTQQWMTLEAVGSYLPVAHYGPGLSSDDVCRGLVCEFSEKMDFLMELVRFREDDLYRERTAHLMWRSTFMESTFAHRVRTICETVGIHHDWIEYPKASLIMPTFRGDRIPECVEKFKRQTYPNKELVIVFNGSDLPFIDGFGHVKHHDDIRVANVPAEMFASACLNQGCLMAQGEYCFRMDDDDFYQPNYLLDMVLQAKCIDADLFGKPPSPVVFEGDPAVYARSSVFPLSIASDVLVRAERQWLGGNSISGKTCFLKDHMYNDHCYGAADTNLLYNIKNPSKFTFAIMDAFNLIAERRKDPDSHTWKLNKDQIIKHCHRLSDIQELTI